MANLAGFRIILGKVKRLLYVEVTTLGDIILFLLRVPAIKDTAQNQPGKKIIVYIGEFLPPRIPRLAKWTKRVGNFHVILLCHEHWFYEKFSNPAIDETYLFRNKWHLRRIIRSLPKPYIAHGFAPKSMYPYFGMSFLKKYHTGTPFVTDYQDVLAIYYGTNPTQRWLKNELPYEKLCMQNSDGIVAHSLEPCEGMKVWGIKKHNERIFFPLYCDNDCFDSPKKDMTKENIHLVYAGGIAGSHRDKGHYGGIQLQWVIEYLKQQKIHIHIYPSPSVAKEDIAEYEQMVNENQFLHLHSSISQSDLSRELSKYHYGIMPFFKENSEQSVVKYKLATTLKLFNYSEAGLPIISGSGVVYQAWIVERYKLGFVIKEKKGFADVRKLIEATPYTEQVENVLNNRETISLSQHIPRLINFYDRLQK